MKICTVNLKSVSPYSQSRAHEEPTLNKETAEAKDLRTWREKMHADEEGNVFIPCMSFKQALDKTAKNLGMQIPGRGKFLMCCFLRRQDFRLRAELQRWGPQEGCFSPIRT